MQRTKEREIWIDNVKVIACILVLAGHFFQSMVKSGIFPENNLYLWFNQTIYCFHVPLFLVCSGYLYQKYSRVEDFESWKTNVLKKALVLGIPYFTFSTVTWALKTLFSGSVNEEIGGLSEVLFLEPTSPYGYLYCLFFIFLITPTFRSPGMAVGCVAVALSFKAISLFGGTLGIYAASSVLSNEIWFAGGMSLCMVDIRRKAGRKMGGVAAIAGMLFLALSILVYTRGIRLAGIDFLLGIIACTAIVVGTTSLYKERNQARALEFLAGYTLPIFLMHTLFAAPIRIILLKTGIKNTIVHMAVGIGISFVGPIAAAEVMARTAHLDFFLYPNKYVNMSSRFKRAGRQKGKYD